jgi:hypothetical protein
MLFNRDFESSPIDIKNTYGFRIIAFPPVKPKYRSLTRLFNEGGLSFYEDEYEQGVYHMEYYVEGMPSPIETKLIISLTQTKKPQINIEYNALGYKKYARKEVFGFANAISSRISWEHKIIWFTEDGKKTIWKNSNKS